MSAPSAEVEAEVKAVRHLRSRTSLIITPGHTWRPGGDRRSRCRDARNEDGCGTGGDQRSGNRGGGRIRRETGAANGESKGAKTDVGRAEADGPNVKAKRTGVGSQIGVKKGGKAWWCHGGFRRDGCRRVVIGALGAVPGFRATVLNVCIC